MQIRNLKNFEQIFAPFLFSILMFFPKFSYAQVNAEVKGQILLSVVDAGGNAGPYGIFYLNGPQNRTQSFACARTSSGLYPTGITDCKTTYGSSSNKEWQPGDVLTARVSKRGGTDIPLDVKPPDRSSCSWEFTGWSGACTGLGTLNSTSNEYECSITLPASGNVTLSAAFLGDVESPCPALTNPNPVTPVPTAATTPNGGTDSDGNRLLSKMNDIADELADNLKLKDLLREIAAKFIIPKGFEFKYEIKATVSAVGEGSTSALPALVGKGKPVKITPITGNPIIASGRGKTTTTKRTVIELESTAKGMKIPKGRTSLEVLITIKALLKGQVVQTVSVTAVID